MTWTEMVHVIRLLTSTARVKGGRHPTAEPRRVLEYHAKMFRGASGSYYRLLSPRQAGSDYRAGKRMSIGKEVA